VKDYSIFECREVDECIIDWSAWGVRKTVVLLATYQQRPLEDYDFA
jgi:hypothetical protein